MKRIFVLISALVLLIGRGGAETNANPQAPANGRSLALVGGTVYPAPDAEPVRDGVVVVEDGRIAAVGERDAVDVPPGIEVLDCAGMTVVAGFWNSHVHFSERKWAGAPSLPAPELERQLQDMLTRYGFTAAFDLSSDWENTRAIRDRIESGEVAGPRIRSTGAGLVPPRGEPSPTVLSLMGFMQLPLHQIPEPGEAATAARALLESGTDGVKLFASSQAGTSLPEGTIEAAAEEAHRAGKWVFIHPGTGADVLAAIRGGADVIAHTTPRSGAWDETLLSAGRERGVALTPTLTLWRYYLRHDRLSTQEPIVAAAVEQLRAWRAAGGTVLFGSDLGAVDYDPAEEYALMAKAGMDFREILAALTTAPAAKFGDGARLGRIVPGFAADLAVFDGDPSADVGGLSAVRYTIRDGAVIYRAGKQ